MTELTLDQPASIQDRLRRFAPIAVTGMAILALAACEKSSDEKPETVDPNSFQCTKISIDALKTRPVVSFTTENGQAESAKVYVGTQKVLNVGPEELADGSFRAGVLTAQANTITVTLFSGDETADCPPVNP